MHYTLEDPEVGRIGLMVSLPHPGPEGPLPASVLVGGLGPGERTLAYLRAPAGDNAIVAYDWPVPETTPRGAGWVLRAPGLYRRILSVPAQVAAALDWASRQPWADERRISLLGFSLGALAAPAAQRLADEAGHAVRWTVLAYGGTDLGELLAAHPRVRPDWVKPLLSRVVDLLLRPIEPAHHLPHLDGRFLVLGGRDDELVPRRPARRFQALTPAPKTTVELGGEHIGMGPGQTALLDEIIRVSRGWLIDRGAIRAPSEGLTELRLTWPRRSAPPP